MPNIRSNPATQNQPGWNFLTIRGSFSGLLIEMLFMVVLGSQPVYGEYRTHAKFRNVFPSVSVHKEINNAFIFVNCFILLY